MHSNQYPGSVQTQCDEDYPGQLDRRTTAPGHPTANNLSVSFDPSELLTCKDNSKHNVCLEFEFNPISPATSSPHTNSQRE